MAKKKLIKSKAVKKVSATKPTDLEYFELMDELGDEKISQKNTKSGKKKFSFSVAESLKEKKICYEFWKAKRKESWIRNHTGYSKTNVNRWIKDFLKY